MNRRKLLIENLIEAIPHHDWEACSEYCFTILYGLPLELQIELSCFMMHRYVRIFETRYPDMHWPKEILDAPTTLVDTFDYTIPDGPEEIDLADSTFLFGFEGLSFAYYHSEHQAVITSACIFAIDCAIGARVDNVWQADDPEAVELWEKRIFPDCLTTVENVASIAVREREWKQVVAWLQRKEVWKYPDTVDLKEMEHGLERWKDSEMTLINPQED